MKHKRPRIPKTILGKNEKIGSISFYISYYTTK